MASDREIWALRDVSFEIPQGDVVGIIGANGAGKSTLLKVLSRITEPTSGSAVIRGRVGSLLEVGTGFHLELTARENIHLNSAILGMPRNRTRQVFDQIVSFAEVERFVDTPVKHFSSGMYLKLAFSVAAHLEPDVLMVDEVLAVGDLAFQKKCLGKMGEVSREGRTVLFVSHNMSAVSELCRTGLLMQHGRASRYDSATAAVAAYLHDLDASPLPDAARPNTTFETGRIRINDSFDSTIRAGESFRVTIPLRAQSVPNPWLFLIVEDSRGQTVIHDRVTSREIGAPVLDDALNLEVCVPALWLSPGAYSLYFKFMLQLTGAGDGRVRSERVVLHVTGDYDETGRSVLKPPLDWLVKASSTSATHTTPAGRLP